MTPSIDITVAAVVERRGRFLVVEETIAGRNVFNQPAGHVEPGEAILDAVIRETIEETGYRLAPEFLVGVYSWQNAESGESFVRISIAGAVSGEVGNAELDVGIVAAHWLTREELTSPVRTLRSPMVLRTIDDYLSGARYSLECLQHVTDSDADTAGRRAAATGSPA